MTAWQAVGATLVGRLLVTLIAEVSFSAGHAPPAKVLEADDICEWPSGVGSSSCAPAVTLLQVQAAAALAKGQDLKPVDLKQSVPDKADEKLAMVHVPCNFGHTIEAVALMSYGSKGADINASFHVPTRDAQWRLIRGAAGPGGEVWGMMNPDLRTVSEATGCDMYYTPQKYWTEELAASYFGNRTIFGMLRNPYDKIVNEFRMQLMVFSSFFSGETRLDVSRREGHMEKEREPYTTWYQTCDVNAWVKAELAAYKKGDRFRGNCHLLPQVEYFHGKHAISVAIDVAKIPQSFNSVMEEHGSAIRMDKEVGHNVFCDVSAWSLDQEAVSLVQEVYAQDFELNCRHFGVCGLEAKECVCSVPQMCGGAPADYCDSRPPLL